MPFTILVPNTYPFRPKRTALLYLVYPGIRFLLCLETSSVSLYANCRSSFTCSYIIIYIVVKCIYIFVDIIFHPNIDVRLCYFFSVDKERLIFTSDVNRMKSPVVFFVIDINTLVDFKGFPGITYVIISYAVFIIYIKFWCSYFFENLIFLFQIFYLVF